MKAALAEVNMLKELQEFDLSESEAQLYLAAIKLGGAPVSEIARKAKVHRTTAYNLLEGLVGKGLLTCRKHFNTKYYVAENPQKLLKMLEYKKQDYERKISNLSGMLPDLNKLFSEPERKQILHYYDGLTGVREAYEDTLRATEEIRAYASIDDIQTYLPDFFPAYYRRRASKGISIRAIFPATLQSMERKKMDRTEFRVSRLVPKSFSFHLEINIYNDKVGIYSVREKFAVIVQSQEIANAQKQIFELAWEAARKYDQEIYGKEND